MTQHDKLLVVRAARPYPHVAQAPAAGCFDFLTEVSVFLLA
jgi:hypothetical protein